MYIFQRWVSEFPLISFTDVLNEQSIVYLRIDDIHKCVWSISPCTHYLPKIVYTFDDELKEHPIRLLVMLTK